MRKRLVALTKVISCIVITLSFSACNSTVSSVNSEDVSSSDELETASSSQDAQKEESQPVAVFLTDPTEKTHQFHPEDGAFRPFITVKNWGSFIIEKDNLVIFTPSTRGIDSGDILPIVPVGYRATVVEFSYVNKPTDGSYDPSGVVTTNFRMDPPIENLKLFYRKYGEVSWAEITLEGKSQESFSDLFISGTANGMMFLIAVPSDTTGTVIITINLMFSQANFSKISIASTGDVSVICSEM